MQGSSLDIELIQATLQAAEAQVRWLVAGSLPPAAAFRVDQRSTRLAHEQLTAMRLQATFDLPPGWAEFVDVDEDLAALLAAQVPAAPPVAAAALASTSHVATGPIPALPADLPLASEHGAPDEAAASHTGAAAQRAEARSAELAARRDATPAPQPAYADWSQHQAHGHPGYEQHQAYGHQGYEQHPGYEQHQAYGHQGHEHHQGYEQHQGYAQHQGYEQQPSPEVQAPTEAPAPQATPETQPVSEATAAEIAPHQAASTPAESPGWAPTFSSAGPESGDRVMDHYARRQTEQWSVQDLHEAHEGGRGEDAEDSLRGVIDRTHAELTMDLPRSHARFDEPDEASAQTQLEPRTETRVDRGGDRARRPAAAAIQLGADGPRVVL